MFEKASVLSAFGEIFSQSSRPEISQQTCQPAKICSRSLMQRDKFYMRYWLQKGLR